MILLKVIYKYTLLMELKKEKKNWREINEIHQTYSMVKYILALETITSRQQILTSSFIAMLKFLIVKKGLINLSSLTRRHGPVLVFSVPARIK